MKIGIDIDNVISNFDEELLNNFLQHDKTLRNKGIVNPSKYIDKGMFDWTQKETNEFYNSIIEKVIPNLKPLREAKQTIDKLKQDGNEIYIISARDNGEYKKPHEITINWLNKYNIYYDKLILVGFNQKGKVCKENNIDIMIDDRVKGCKEISEEGTRCFLMDTRYNRDCKEFERVYNWNDIYLKITELNEKLPAEKLNVILDTDTYNESDDQFALAYLLKSQDIFNIEAITVAPYKHENGITIEEGQEKSYQEVLKICNWSGFETERKVYKGSVDYIQNGYDKRNEAVEKIIETANKNKKTYIIGIGAITNIALAIKLEPKIIEKIEIVWLGGNSLLSKDNQEYNFRQDIDAVKIVFKSKVKLTIIPCKNVASHLVTSIYEVENYLKGKNELCNYLCERFLNDEVHRITQRRIIWDISAIAYLINKNWFETIEINCPDINEDTSYKIHTNNHLMTMVNYLNSDAIYKDVFRKIG